MQQLGDRDMAAGLLFSCCHSSFSESVAWGPGRSVGFNKWLSCQFWAKGTSDSSRIAALDFCSASNQSFPVWCELAVTSENVPPRPRVISLDDVSHGLTGTCCIVNLWFSLWAISVAVSLLLSVSLWSPSPILGEFSPRAEKYYRLISAGCVRKRLWKQDATWSVIILFAETWSLLTWTDHSCWKKNNLVIFSWIQPYGTALPEAPFCFPFQTPRSAIWTSRLTTQYTNSLPNLADGFHISKGLFINVHIFSLAYLHIAQKPAYNTRQICMRVMSQE